MRPHSQVFASYLCAPPRADCPPAPCTSHLPRAHSTCPVHMAARRHADGLFMPCLFMPCQAQLMNSHTVVHAQLTAEAAQAAPP